LEQAWQTSSEKTNKTTLIDLSPYDVTH